MSGQSTVALRHGQLFESIELPGFRELGSSFELSLVYLSSAANATVLLDGIAIYGNRPVERSEFEFFVEGNTVSGIYGKTNPTSTPGAPGGFLHEIYAKYIWDGRDPGGALMSTGTYQYSIFATSYDGNVNVARPATFGESGPCGPTIVCYPFFYPGIPTLNNAIKRRFVVTEGRATLLNLRDSPYGAGWMLSLENRLYFDPDGCVVLVEGYGATYAFIPDPADPTRWLSPAGHFDELRFNPTDGTIRRESQNGSVERYSADGRIQEIVDRYGRAIVFSYTGNQLASITSRTGFAYNLTYDGAGKLMSITDSAGRASGIVVNAAGDLTTFVDALGSQRAFGYDSEHLLTSQTGPRGERSEYDYVRGRVVASRAYDVDGTTLLRERHYDSDALHGELGLGLASGLGGSIDTPIPPTTRRFDRYIDGRGAITTYEANRLGVTTRIIDPLGRVTSYGFDANFLLTEIRYPNNARTRFVYDEHGNRIARHEDDPSGALYSTETYEYDAFGQLARTVDAEVSATTFVYGPTGLLASIEDALGNQTSYFYEDPAHADLPTRTVLANGAQYTLTYDEHGNPLTSTDPLGRVTSLDNSDDTGLLESRTNPALEIVSYEYDALNRVTRTEGEEVPWVEYFYDEAACGGCGTANLTRVLFPNGGELNYEYDGLNRKTRRIDQLGRATTYEYDEEDSLTLQTNRAGQSITSTYDAAGQLLAQTIDGSGAQVFAYDNMGRMTAADNANIQLDMSYDFLGRTSAATTTYLAGGVLNLVIPLSFTLGYQYDKVGNRTVMTTPVGNHSYTYDDVHRREQQTDPWGNSYSFAYDALHRMVQLSRSNGTVTQHSFDMAGQMTLLAHYSAGVAVQSTTFNLYDGAGRLLHESVTGLGAREVEYEYDAFGRLTGASSSLAVGDVLANPTTSFDLANRMRADSEHVFEYDMEGRLVSEAPLVDATTTSFVFDSADRLLQVIERIDIGGSRETVMIVDYLCDALGRRVAKVINGVAEARLYDHFDLLAEFSSRGILDAGHVHGSDVDRPLATRVSTGGQMFYHLDRTSSGGLVSNVFGTLLLNANFDEFGAGLTPQTLAPSSYGFTSRDLDVESPSTNYRFRYLDPERGRFLSEDPIDLLGGTNHYAYVANDPVNRLDPFGLLEDPIEFSDSDGKLHRVCGAGLCLKLVKQQDCVQVGEFTSCEERKVWTCAICKKRRRLLVPDRSNGDCRG